MERSSPLAAMQPPTMLFGGGHWTCGGDRLSSGANLAPPPPRFGQNAFNFKEMSSRKTDYFGFKPSHGNSPTANLAVDLSQNFHIDRSPAPPTPRRSLFSAPGIKIDTNALKTPPPASSSPCPMVESMEISPLPHKTPFTQIQVHSPTPESTPNEVPMEDTMVASPIEMGPPPPPKRPAVLRPTFSRAKGYSTTAVATKSATFPMTQPFTFGVAPVLTLDDCFIESPPRGAMLALAPPVAIGRPKSATQKGGFAPPPVRNFAPYQRPRKQFRRSLSMFEHPEDVIHQQDRAQEALLQPIMDLDEGPQLQLPHFFADQESIPRIAKDTMVDVLDGKYSRYANTTIVDCRFEYEYKGGHIEGAVNFNDKEELAKTLFGLAPENTLLIFHCEYSAHRAPIAARFIRGEDRNTNAHQYPKLTYPEVYILDGGYSAFFKDHKARCFPQNYVEMNDKEYAGACERGLGRIKQQRAKLCRAQTFAFGQSVNDSPTAVARAPTSTLMSGMDIIFTEPEQSRRLETKRTASY